MSYSTMNSRVRAIRNQIGFTLVELMVAVATGLLVTVAAGAVYVVARQGFQTNDDRTRILENGRLAMDVLTRNTRMAGAPNVDVSDPDAPIVFAPPPGFVAGVFGTEGGGAPDTLTISYASNQVYNAARLTGADCLGQAVGIGNVINTFAISANGQLTCQGNGGGGAQPAQPIVGPIVDMQVQYTEVTNLGPQPSQDPPVPIVAVVNASGVTNWGNVRAVDICIEVVSFEPNTITGASFGVNCRGAAFPADNRVHRTFRTKINLRNNTRGNVYAPDVAV
jgi:type IV pilus assembly protein PilW